MAARRLGIIGAMDSEVEHLKSNLVDAHTELVSQMEFFVGKLGSSEVVVVKCGYGKVNAAVCAQTLILRFGVTAIINTGVAGSLDASIDIGDIVVSTDAVQHDYDITELGFQLGYIPGFDELGFPASAELRAKVCEAAAEVAPEVGVREGRIASGDVFVSGQADKVRISREFGALCCEMEGAAIAQVCCLNEVPFVIVRAISDKADGSSSMDFETFQQQAAERCARIVERCVR